MEIRKAIIPLTIGACTIFAIVAGIFIVNHEQSSDTSQLLTSAIEAQDKQLKDAIEPKPEDKFVFKETGGVLPPKPTVMAQQQISVEVEPQEPPKIEPAPKDPEDEKFEQMIDEGIANANINMPDGVVPGYSDKEIINDELVEQAASKIDFSHFKYVDFVYFFSNHPRFGDTKLTLALARSLTNARNRLKINLNKKIESINSVEMEYMKPFHARPNMDRRMKVDCYKITYDFKLTD